MAKLAFLTEVRDCEKYLPQAVESILNQTYRDYDYYITDDGSTDGTRGIIAAYAARDPRIIPSWREGAMHANFNRTLERIRRSGAEYFALLDADDWYEPDFAETLVSMLESTGADLAECSFTAHDENGGGEDALPGFGDGVVSLQEFADQFASYSFFDSIQQWWGKIYRIPVMNRIGLLAGEGWDTAFVLRYRAACRSFAFCGRHLHHYRIRETSDCHKRLTRFDGRRAAGALEIQHAAREALLGAAGCENPQSRLMAAYQDVNGVRSNMMRLYAGTVPPETAAEEILHLLRLPFLAPAYEAVERSFEETGRLFFARPEDSARAMTDIRSYYGLFLRMAYRYTRGNDAFVFQWLCRVFPELEPFFELEDLPVLMAEEAASIALLERRYRQALAGLRTAGPADILRVFLSVRLRAEPDYIRRFRAARGTELSDRKRAFLDLQTGL